MLVIVFSACTYAPRERERKREKEREPSWGCMIAQTNYTRRERENSLNSRRTKTIKWKKDNWKRGREEV